MRKLTPNQKKVYEAVKADQTQLVKDIVEKTGISLDSVRAALSSLTRKGLISPILEKWRIN